jgi:hypothetical protein
VYIKQILKDSLTSGRIRKDLYLSGTSGPETDPQQSQKPNPDTEIRINIEVKNSVAVKAQIGAVEGL